MPAVNMIAPQATASFVLFRIVFRMIAPQWFYLDLVKLNWFRTSPL
jgi:hypothetical protein